VTVEVQWIGNVGDDAVVLGHRILVDAKVCATAKTVRRLLGFPRDAWVRALVRSKEKV
jgi:hypothetical protein